MLCLKALKMLENIRGEKNVRGEKGMLHSRGGRTPLYKIQKS